MALTLCFRMGGVDIPRMFEYFEQNPDEFGMHPRLGRYMRDYRRSCILAGFQQLVDRAVENGDLPPELVRETGISVHRMPRSDEVVLNTMAISVTDALDAAGIARAEIVGRRSVVRIANFAKKCQPGFESSHLIDTGMQIGVRETRRDLGDYLLTVEDIQ